MAANAQTLLAYENHVAEYIEQTSQEVEGAAKEWIDSALVDLPSNAKLLELGSAFGRDAAYIASKGYSIECTDAAENFVSYLRDKGFHARLFNAITDELDDEYDLILASAVMLHFIREELALALRKLCASLNPRGRLAISLKRGEGDAWSTEKLGAPDTSVTGKLRTWNLFSALLVSPGGLLTIPGRRGTLLPGSTLSEPNNLSAISSARHKSSKSSSLQPSIAFARAVSGRS